MTEKFVHTENLLHRATFRIKELLHTDALTHREGFTQKRSHTHTHMFLHREPKRLHLRFQNCIFATGFDVRTSFRARGVASEFPIRNFTSAFDVRPSLRATGLRLIFQNDNFTQQFFRPFGLTL